MKREGRQHGTVRTYCILPSSPLNPNGPVQRKASPTLASPPTAGIFTRVPAKPTNHSKFTGKCGRARCSDCHLHPSWKSKDKIKGARSKLRSSDVDLGHGGLYAWRVTGKYDNESWPYYKMKLDSQSASDILYELYSDHYEESDDIDYSCGLDDYPYDFYGNMTYKYKYGRTRRLYGDFPIVEAPKLNLDCLGEYPFLSSPIDRVSTEMDEVDDRDVSMANGFGEIDLLEDDEDEDDDDDDDDMGFYDVAIVWEPIDGDEGWSLVGEM